MLTLTLTPQDFATIVKGLGTLPLAEAMQTFMNVTGQAERQRRAAEQPTGDQPAQPASET